MTATGRIDVLGVELDPLTAEEAVDEVVAAAVNGEGGRMSTVNVAVTMMSRNEPVLTDYLRSSRWAVADGQPVVWLSKATGEPLPERVGGIDLIDPVCARAAREDFPVYLLGASEEVVAATAERMEAAHPGLEVHWADGYFGPGEAADRARAIAATGARVLFVGMGVPRQERFLLEQWELLGNPVAIGVGGSFDVLAGRVSRAPGWMQRAGLEWAYRLAQEPGRLWRRYLVTNSMFLGAAAREIVRRRLR
ncbi:WecB/TagA/CpsF family glycosyltransferase [Actinomycetota bacterium]